MHAFTQEGFSFDSGGRSGVPDGPKGATAAELMLRHLSDPVQGLRGSMRQSSGTGMDMRRCARFRACACTLCPHSAGAHHRAPRDGVCRCQPGMTRWKRHEAGSWHASVAPGQALFIRVGNLRTFLHMPLWPWLLAEAACMTGTLMSNLCFTDLTANRRWWTRSLGTQLPNE